MQKHLSKSDPQALFSKHGISPLSEKVLRETPGHNLYSHHNAWWKNLLADHHDR